MHYTGTIWRPPYEAPSLLLEVTAGCTHHRCKFCTLYDDLAFSFRMSPLEDIEADLKEVRGHSVERTFLTGANPFVLKAQRLLQIAELIKKYVPKNKTIGCFARITDITLKTDLELEQLHKAGYDGLTIGIETGDEEALQFMNKGYRSGDIVEQCRRLERAGIGYSFFYLAGISGKGRGEEGASATAKICNQLHPKLIGVNMLTIYPQSELYQEMKKGNWEAQEELEKYQEMRTLVENLEIAVTFGALGASNAVPIWGQLPNDTENILSVLDEIIYHFSEEELMKYRKNLPHL